MSATETRFFNTTAEARMLRALTAELPGAIRAATTTEHGAPAPGPGGAAIGLMAAMLGRRAELIDGVGQLIDPDTAPDDALPWLAAWFGWGWMFRDPDDPRKTMDLERAFPPPAENLRALIRAWPAVNEVRGRAEGLRMTLSIATGLDAIEVHVDPAHEYVYPKRQHVAVVVRGAPPEWRPWLGAMIAAERPAHLTWSLIMEEISS